MNGHSEAEFKPISLPPEQRDPETKLSCLLTSQIHNLLSLFLTSNCGPKLDLQTWGSLRLAVHSQPLRMPGNPGP